MNPFAESTISFDMKRKITNIFVLLLFLFIFPGYSVQELSRRAIPVYEISNFKRPFRVIGKVIVKASSPEKLHRKIQSKARKYGGDAILSYEVEHIGDDTSYALGLIGFSAGLVSYGEGYIIVFDEQGINKIDKKAAIPVLP